MTRHTFRVFHHPQRGVVLSDGPLNPMWARHRGGADSGWTELTPVAVEPGSDGVYHPTAGQVLPRGFRWGVPSRQLFGLSGPRIIFGPLEKVCRTCKASFVFTADEQKHWYERLGFFIDATAVHCRPCRAARQALEGARRSYEVALRAATDAPSADRHLAVAEAALQLIRAGGHVRIDKALGHCTRARRLGAGPKAVRLGERLRKLRS